jgi:alkylated DNA nucleotide flippase Atl1
MSALDRLRKPQAPKIVREMPPRVAHWAPPGGSMVISTPAEVDEVIRRIPKGKLATINSLRDVLAKRHGTDIACPVTTGIFANISMQASAEEEIMGAKRTAPWWRVLKSDGKLNEKAPGGVEEHKRRLAAEGFAFETAGKKGWRVVEFETKLAVLN